MLFAAVGEIRFVTRRLEKLPPPAGKTRSAGFTFSKFPDGTIIVLGWISVGVSVARSLPFLLSLRLSRIPFALRFLTAGLRAKAPDEDSWRRCAEYGLAETAVIDSSLSLLANTAVLMYKGIAALGRVVADGRGAIGEHGCSSLQSAGVGGTGARAVPLPGGRRDRDAETVRRSMGDDSKDLFRLCERVLAGGGPGGGGGNGMPGSHRV